ncbi:MAG: uroporphyrinogen decarboxylase family protein [Anaerolineae bacterium]
MTMRSDALKALRGEQPEHLPFIARMDLWYNYNKSCGTLPAPYQSAGLWDIQRDLGIGVLGFGAWIRGFYRLEYDDTVTARSWWEGMERVDEYVTPYGTLRGRSLISEQLQAADVTPTHIAYPFKTADDYDALQYLFDHTKVVENYDEYNRYLTGIGDAGLSLPFTSWVPMHLLMKEYIGYNQFYYELYDNLPRLERLVESVTRVQMDMVRLGIDSPAQVIEVGANYDQVMTPPPIFREYMLPFYKQVVPMLHAAGKVVALHGDGDMGPELLGLMAETGVDAVEALTPRPMTSIDVSTTRALWGNRMTLWGGIPGILMTDTYSDEDLETFLEELFAAVAPGNRFVLGFGDNVPTNGLYSRILQVVDFYHRHSSYPLG